MASLPEAARCPECGLTLLEHAELREAGPRKREQSKLLQALKEFVPRYTSHNNALEQSLRTSRVGGSVRGAHRFNDE